MPTRRTIVASALLALCAAAAAYAQSAVLVLSPGPTTTIRAGTGTSGFSSYGSSATTVRFAAPSAMAQDAAGNLYLADTRNHRIRRVALNGTTSTIAGDGTQGFSGDEGPAAAAQLDSPQGLAVTASGDLYLADTRNNRIRLIDSAGIIHTVAGSGRRGFSGDGAAATAASLALPEGLAIGPTGDLYLADTGNHRVRRVAADGAINTVAGSGLQGNAGDEGPAAAAALSAPTGLAFRADGALLIADRGNNRIRLLTADGVIHAVTSGTLQLRRPQAIALTPAQDVLVADSANYRVAQIGSTGAGTALGSGVQGRFDTTSAPALSAFGLPAALTTDNAGGFTALDHDRGQVVQVSLPTLAFPDTVTATRSQPLTLTLRNPGAAALTVTATAIPTGFAQGTSTCGTPPFQLPANTSCNLALLFTPTANGAVSGTLQVAILNGASQSANLTGTGVVTGTLLASSTTLQTSGSIAYAGTPVTLTARVLGTSSALPTGSITFLDSTQALGTSPLDANAAAALTTPSLAVGAHTLTARFSGNGTYGTSTSLPVQQTVALAPDFTLTAATSRIAMKSTDPGATTLTLQPTNGVLNHAVALQMSGLPANSTASITPTTVLLAGDPVTVNVTFKLPLNVTRHEPPHLNRRHLWILAFLAPVLAERRRSSRSNALPRLCAFALLLTVPCLLLAGCGGGYTGNGSNVTAQSASQTYPVTITATTTGVSGEPLTHTATFTVVVQ